MTVVSHARKSQWRPATFTIRQIDRETLSLLMVFALEALARPENAGKYGNLPAVAKAIDDYVNADALARSVPLAVAWSTTTPE